MLGLDTHFEMFVFLDREKKLDSKIRKAFKTVWILPTSIYVIVLRESDETKFQFSKNVGLSLSAALNGPFVI